ncbi:farnesyltransferase beta subunit [Reticulomyxa filosa]|uniref:Farnesyltransferase beta subunit n=1 Tax=Reticulomyxa filosa TaxID=46433 RepID=X6MWX6_RETFI|nr:farnesyltransferase beta subunit [Reticulomyxa filosa]|eukprot:ETO17590.1 farnesyltransferase beta subunit [Reticulomyxa filosa]
MCQMSYAGGFQGRTHKLVDTCYSFWVGGLFPLINIASSLQKNPNETGKENDSIPFYWQNSKTLTNPTKESNNTITDISDESNNKDKNEEKNADSSNTKTADNVPLVKFHTLQLQKYVLICAQHSSGGIVDKPPKSPDYYHTCYGLSGLSIAQHLDNQVLGDNRRNHVNEIDPLYGISKQKLTDAIAYFHALPRITEK